MDDKDFGLCSVFYFNCKKNTTVMPRNAFQANRKEEVLHSGRMGPLSPSGKQAENTVSALQKLFSFLECTHCFLSCLPEGERGPTLPE